MNLEAIKALNVSRKTAQQHFDEHRNLFTKALGEMEAAKKEMDRMEGRIADLDIAIVDLGGTLEE